MPNHIKNVLTINGTPEQVKEVREFLAGEPWEDGTSRLIDFRKIIPIPKIFEEIGEVHNGLVEAAQKACGITPKYGFGNFQFEIKPEEQEVFSKMVLAGKSTGFVYWYDYNAYFWRTKWNAYAQLEIAENCIKWETAWAGVHNLVSIVAAKFPLVAFEYKYADEDTGSNVGRLTFEAGVVTHINIPKNQSNEAYELYFELNPEDREDYEVVDGNYRGKEYEEEEE